MSNWETALQLLAAAAQVASGASSVVDLGTRDRLLRQTVNVTAAAGSLIARLESSPLASGPWKTFATFAQAQGISSESISAVSLDRYVRVAWTLSGGATFSVSGTQGICFASLAQLDKLGIPAAAIAKLSATDKAEQLAATTEMASGILARRYTLPIVAWGVDLSAAVAKIAAYELLSTRGFNADGSDDQVRKRYDDGMRWLNDAANARLDPIGLIDSDVTDVDVVQPEMDSLPRRGW